MAKRLKIVTEISPEKAERYRNTSMIFTLRPGQAQALSKMRKEREQAEAARVSQPPANDTPKTSESPTNHHISENQ
jgi:hypothetical protein